ncbi:MAG: GTPase, partial [Candidatus Flemingiibacterium sp.]
RVQLGRVMLNLVDTAGIRETGDEVERLGVERSLEALKRAGLILAVFDGSKEPDDGDSELLSRLSDLSGVKIAVMNKSDLGGSAKAPEGFEHIVRLSAKTGEGVGELKELIEELFAGEKLDYDSQAVVMSARQNASVTRALGYVTTALEALKAGATDDTAGLELEEALSELSELDGRRVTEEIVDGIFHRFCVGK